MPSIMSHHACINYHSHPLNGWLYCPRFVDEETEAQIHMAAKRKSQSLNPGIWPQSLALGSTMSIRLLVLKILPFQTLGIAVRSSLYTKQENLIITS